MGASVDGIEGRFDRRVIGRAEDAACRKDGYRSPAWWRRAGNNLRAACPVGLTWRGYTWRVGCQTKADREGNADRDKHRQANASGSVEGTLKGGDFLHLIKPMRKRAAKTDIFDFFAEMF